MHEQETARPCDDRRDIGAVALAGLESPEGFGESARALGLEGHVEGVAVERRACNRLVAVVHLLSGIRRERGCMFRA